MFFRTEEVISLKGNITFVCAHTANAAWFFTAIIIVTSNVTQKCQHRISRLFVSGFLCFKSALNPLYGTYVTWEFWFTNEISKRRWEKCITNRAEWTSSSVLHCNVTVAARRRENTCLRRMFSLITKIWSESFDFALSLLLTHVVYMKINITMCDRQWFT